MFHLDLLLTLTIVAPSGPASQDSGVLLLRDVHVIPLDVPHVLEHQSLLVQDGWIAALGPADELDAPEGATVVEGNGRYLLPGLVDLNVQLEFEPVVQEAILDVCLAHGVTSVLNVQGGTHTRALRAQRRGSDTASPRIYSSGPRVDDGALGFEAGRLLVQRQRRAGFEFASIGAGVAEQGFKGIATGAGEIGARVVGEVPSAIGLEGALSGGLEAVTSVVDLALGFAATDLYEPWSVEATTELIELVSNSGATVITALGAWTSGRTASAELGEAGAFVAPAVVETAWKVEPALETAEREEAAVAQLHALTLALRQAGVPLAAGSGAMRPGCIPGVALHRELQLLQDIGLTPFEVLVAATRTPAEFLGTDAVSGTVDVHKRADLILLEGNPLEDLSNLGRLAGVVVAGRWLSAQDCAARLARVRDAHELQAAYSSAGDRAAATRSLERLRELDPEGEFGKWATERLEGLRDD